MTATRAATATRTTARSRKVVIGWATLGGLVTAGGFFWVNSVAVARTDSFGPSWWVGASTAPGLAAFIAGSVVLLAALIVIRRRVQPGTGGRLVWLAGWFGWAAITLDFVGTTTRIANPFSGVGAFVEVGSFAVGAVAEVIVAFGLAFVILRRMDDAQPGGAAIAASTGRRRHIVAGIAMAVAILSALLAAAGYCAISALQQAYSNNADVSRWNAAALEPGVAEFIAGSVVLLAALTTTRFHLRPRTGARFIWTSVWFFWVAIALNGLGLGFAAAPGSGSGSSLVFVSLIVEIPAVVLLLFGLRLLVVRRQVSPLS